ncbi:LytR/AlgR family response regulator transcription factor [Gilvimarinus polysaccharolyticus]|uniref:LytR/AlgR family response regulator transcription factor n=1 Tax=Gilvimarinus polysaccharolyticus TaxID=863921 RepID=UPI0006735E5E|nr:LytTR family DNA-binding domain-containing protein [Gilvimarinus polysaccharolyticus]
MLDVLIVDDEPLARARLVRMIDQLSDYQVSAEATDGEQALAAVVQHDPDIVLLDIHMPGEDGLQAAQAISELDAPPAIIFCTAFSEHALDAFATSAVGYLLKPVRLEQLEAALAKVTQLNKMQRAAARGTTSRTSITAKTHRGIERIALNDIRYFLADQKYVTVYHTGGQHLLDTTLKELENEFGDQLLRVHRNALVSVPHIQALERCPDGGLQVRLADTDIAPSVSRRHASDVKALLQQL